MAPVKAVKIPQPNAAAFAVWWDKIIFKNLHKSPFLE